jgi:hypothetical protein
MPTYAQRQIVVEDKVDPDHHVPECEPDAG